MCDEDRELSQAEARGQFHRVKLRVTVELEVDVPGATHETADLEEFVYGTELDEAEIVDWEVV